MRRVSTGLHASFTHGFASSVGTLRVPTPLSEGEEANSHAVSTKDWARFAPSVGTLRVPTPLSRGDRVNSHPLL